ncbi:hypothetical protein [Riemerella columbipharyngis]|uniref:Uncharacterized protein n=1 Tax=Riemerella columbipharyngis TaxID=1071918 RepID=A0A1G6YHW3_9FLAO|nr:hypothetical protein [Riemerella columbipharyngis]SDD89940.1 hypothetical protein SAMN05421544_101170 [Riemerella columbipharyngis]
MKRFYIAILFFFCALSFAQFKHYSLSGVGSISISDGMEKQSSLYRARVGVPEVPDKVVFQQKGLNDLEASATNTYARIIVETEYGDFDKLSSVPVELSQEDKEYIRYGIANTLSLQGQKLIKFLGINSVVVNRQACIKISYIRQLNDNPLVRVDYYLFENGNKMHKLAISYRLNESERWKSLLEKSVKSFKIENHKW